MKTLIVVIAIIGCVMASPPIVTTLVSDYDQNTFHLQNGPPVGGSISAVLPSVGSILPILTELAPLALSLGNLGTAGARLLPALPQVSLPSLPPFQLPSIAPFQLPPIPIPIPSFTPVTYSRSVVPYPYSIYAGARLY